MSKESAEQGRGLFDSILKLDEEGAGADGSGTAAQASPEAKENKKFLDKIAEIENEKNELKKRLDSVSKNTEYVAKMRDIFSPNEEEERIRKQKETIREFDENPAAYIEKQRELEERVKALSGAVENTTRAFNAKEVTSKIDKRYDIDWEKDSEKIVAELNDISPELKQKNPEAALEKAIRLAGVGKKREAPLPYFESDTMNAEAIRKRQLSEADKMKRGILSNVRHGPRTAADLLK